MKTAALFTLLILGTGYAKVDMQMQDKTITKVVKLLQGMLDTSVKEGDEERKIFAKFKCYCDQSEQEKKDSIEKNTKEISILESKIEEMQGSNGELSSQCAKLKADMADNEAARKEAEGIRNKQHKAFVDERDDLKQAIGQMKDAIETLAKVGADQTKSTGADNKQFMAKASMLQSTMRSALSAAEAFMDEKQYSSFNSFLQAPFTGTYTSQSGAVMGIIKNMRDTFKANLETAITNEASQLESHKAFMKVKEEAHKEMSDMYDEAQNNLGGNDGELSSSRKQLAAAEKQKADDEDFLEKLVPMCQKKTESYEHRKEMRAGEEVAIAQAISILNSDDAFATFGGVDATSTGKTSFLQISRHSPTDDVRSVVQRLLRRAADEENHKAPRLSHVISALQAGNPFDTVLKEIAKMIQVIKDEGKADKEKLEWCNSEREDSDKSLKEKNADILGLKNRIDKLTKTIEDPVTGLKQQISETETSLLENDKSQKTETADRTEANVAYQADVKNLGSAKGLLKNAITVLKNYYDKIDKAFLQSYGQDPDPPKTWEGDYKGQSDKGGDVISMLQFILKETEKEESDAHADEEKAQATYEDSMTALKKEQANLENRLANLQETLAEKEKDLLTAQEDLKQTTKDRDAVEDYLSKIKPGCDFITKNFDLRNKNRDIETKALQTARDSLKGSPAYKSAVAEATVESYGDCKEPCVKDATHVECKACRADVTVPAYCAGHKGTKGC